MFPFRSLLAAVVALSGFGCAATPSARQAPDATAPAEKRDRQEVGSGGSRSTKSIGTCLSRVEKALALVMETPESSPPRTQALSAYGQDVARLVMVLQHQSGGVLDGKPADFAGDTGTYRVRLATGEGVLKPETFDRFLIASEISRKHLSRDVRRQGLGAPLVGVIQPAPGQAQNCPPQGWAQPVTAVAMFGKPSPAGETIVTLSFLDPQVTDRVTVQKERFALAADFTAPLASYPHPNKMLFGFAAMLRSDKSFTRSGLYFYEPYNSRKIPVIFVHGLMSSPHAWLPFINELNADPGFRKRYQAWVYFYPSGLPIAANALRLRRALADLSRRHALKNNIVLVGHSMGGILAKMQVSNSRAELWKGIFGKNADSLRAQFPPDSLIRQALFFQANPHIARVIFISTPHLGSRLATLRISSWFGSVIRMPSTVLHGFNPEYQKVLRSIEPSLRAIPSSIAGLSPGSPLLKQLRQLPIPVPYHSIIGNRGRADEALSESSDGVVPYWSSHLPGANSEIIVPTGHDAFDHPHAVAEVRRILGL